MGWALAARSRPQRGARGSGDVVHTAPVTTRNPPLQSVEPSVALHYWDFTIDAEEFGTSARTETFFFSDGFFGPLEPEDDAANTDKRITGRFGDVTVLRVDSAEAEEARNSYGIITNSMNNNPSLYLTR